MGRPINVKNTQRPFNVRPLCFESRIKGIVELSIPRFKKPI